MSELQMWLVLALVVFPGFVATVVLLAVSWQEWRDFDPGSTPSVEDFDDIHMEWP